MRRMLYPGRFQPFHKGHLSVVLSFLERFDEVVIVIGSAQEAFTCRNPFTAGERMEMINRVLRSRGIPRDRYWLIPVPDIRMPPAWTSHVLAMVPRVDMVATGNPHVAYLYEWLGLPVERIKLYEPSRYNGTFVRSLIAENGDWRKLVPGEVAEYIESIDGIRRIREVCRGAGGDRRINR